MNENDPLNSVLREWQAPGAPSTLDARVSKAYRGLHRRSLWRLMWSARVTIPVPVLAALLLIAAVLWLQFRSRSHVVQPAITAPVTGEYMTRIENAGFKPLPDGAVRIIRAGERKP